MPSRPSTGERTGAGRTPIRVVVVAHGPPMRGGISTVAMDIVDNEQLNAEFEVVFFNTSQNDDGRGEFGLENIVRAFGHAWGTFRRAQRGSVVHTHSVQDPVFVAWRQVAIAAAARLRGARVLLHNHGYLPYMNEPGRYRVGRAHRLAFRLLDRLCDANIVIGEAGIANLRPYMPHIELPVVHNSVVLDGVTPTSAVHDPPRILFIGELLERKGLLVLLDALDLLDESGRPYELVLVGDDTPGRDPDKDEMVRTITARGRSGALTGAIDRDEVYERLAGADIFVLPTEYEGQPFTIIESLAAGVPIVASDIPAIASMITDGDNGTLVPWGDAAALHDAIVSLLEDPDERRRISKLNRRAAHERYDRSVFVEHLAALYHRSGRARGGAPR
ncbi:MAG: glycosyltransferase family 4 protein [Microthrixaceae bacterium]